MEPHNNFSDEAFILKFADCSLDPKLFSHEAHLRLAWIYIKNDGVEAAIEKISSQIKKFAEHHGAYNKYNLTVTVAAIRTVYHYYINSDCKTFIAFIRAYPQLKYTFKELLDSHYSMDIFSSEQARKKFIYPDLIPFDTPDKE